MAPTEFQAMRDCLGAHRMAVSAELNAFCHLVVRVMPPWISEGCASVAAAASTFGNIVNEAPVATREARVETKPLLLIVLMADMTPPPFLAYAPWEHRSESRFRRTKPRRRYQILRTVLGIER